MKTVSVRIKADQAKQLQEIAGMMPGASINGLAQRGVELFLDIEAPVYAAMFREAQGKLARTKKVIQGPRTVKRF